LRASVVQFFAQANHAHLDVGFLRFAHGHAHALGHLLKAKSRIGRLRKGLQQRGLGGRDADGTGGPGQIEFVKSEHSMLTDLQMLAIKGNLLIESFQSLSNY